MERVAAVLEGWARHLGAGEGDVLRWRAAAFLHDALRDAEGEEVRAILEGNEGTASAEWRIDRGAFDLGAGGGGWASVTGAVLHGPAAAVLLAGEGVRDEELLEAVAYHTVGHPCLVAGPGGRDGGSPSLPALGGALFCADFVEPGRSIDEERRSALRARYPEEPNEVCREILSSRMRYLLQRGRPIFPGTVQLWNRLTR